MSINLNNSPQELLEVLIKNYNPDYLEEKIIRSNLENVSINYRDDLFPVQYESIDTIETRLEEIILECDDRKLKHELELLQNLISSLS